jgi:hypothetical protein
MGESPIVPKSQEITGRLRGVRRRKRPRQGFASEALAEKMRLVRIHRRGH